MESKVWEGAYSQKNSIMRNYFRQRCEHFTNFFYGGGSKTSLLMPIVI